MYVCHHTSSAGHKLKGNKNNNEKNNKKKIEAVGIAEVDIEAVLRYQSKVQHTDTDTDTGLL